jgi:heme-degrading monooxygenase HmoA
MTRTFFGFYEMDASPQHGVAGDLAARLGSASEADGFVDGAVYVRSDAAAVAIELRHRDEDGWHERGLPAVLLQAADWRSRESDARPYRLARTVAGDGDAPGDSTFFIVQRFTVKAGQQAAFVQAICDHAATYAAPIPGFLAAAAYASLDGTRAVFVMPWAHEAALNSLENREGALEAMQTHLRMTEHHSYASYQRISYLRAQRENV